MENVVDQAVILMGGLGTRFLPATKIIPKEFFPIGNKPAFMYHLQELYASGIKRVCIILSKKKKRVKKFFHKDPYLEKCLKNLDREHLLEEYDNLMKNLEISFVMQGKLKGSGGALYYAKRWTKGKPFALILGDDLCKTTDGNPPAIAQLCAAFKKTGKTVIGAKKFPIKVVPRYSSIVKEEKLFDKCHSISDIIEKPQNPPSNLVGLARYVITNEIFDEILKCPKMVNDEIRFTDALTNLARKGRAVCYEFDAKYYDFGNRLEYAKCIIDTMLEDETISKDFKKYIKQKSE